MMRKFKRRAAAVSLVLILAVIPGCGRKESRYSYRDAGIEALNTGNYDEAIEAFDQAIDSSKGMVGKFDKDVLKYKAEAQYLSKDYSAAAETYGILLEVDGERAEYYNMRTVSRAGAGDFKGALEDYEKGGELDPQKQAPGRLEALLAAGAAMEEEEETDKAMALYQEALESGTQSARLYNRMGLCEMADEKWDEAMEYFTKGLAAPDSSQVPGLLFNQAVANERKGDFKTALDFMQQYVSAHGPDEEAEREITFLKTR